MMFFLYFFICLKHDNYKSKILLQIKIYRRTLIMNIFQLICNSNNNNKASKRNFSKVSFNVVMMDNKPKVGIAIWTFLCHSHINVHEHKFMKFFFSMLNICYLTSYEVFSTKFYDNCYDKR